MEDLNGIGKLIGALAVGALAGTAVGLILAPEKGSKTRHDIAGGAKDLRSGINKKMTDKAAVLRKKAENLAKAKVEEVCDDGKPKAETVKEDHK